MAIQYTVSCTRPNISYTVTYNGTAVKYGVGFSKGDQGDQGIPGLDGDGTAESISYDPTASGLTATEVQAAIDELADEVPAWSEITDKPSTFAPIIGSGAGDAVAGNDSRLTNARTPTAHTHPLAELTGVTPAAIGAEPAKGADDNYVTDAEKAALHPAETAASIAALTTGSTAKTTLVDADEIAITDSAAAFGPKKTTLTSLWTWVVTKLGALTSLTAGGAWAFSSTTRPTSSGTGTPEATSLITRADGDARFSLAKASAYKSSDQLALTAGSYNKITFDVEDYDIGSCFASSTWTAPYDCKVLVTVGVYANGTAGSDSMAIYKNGAQHKRLLSKTVASAEFVLGSCVVTCTAGNTLDIWYLNQNARSILGASTITWVQFTVIP